MGFIATAQTVAVLLSVWFTLWLIKLALCRHVNNLRQAMAHLDDDKRTRTQARARAQARARKHEHEREQTEGGNLWI